MDARDQVIEAAEARARALAKNDSDALRRLLHEEFRWTTHAGVTLHRDDYIDRNTAGAVRWHSQRLADVEITVIGDTAILHAEVTDSVQTGDTTEDLQMPMTQVWIREGERWQCLAGHAGPSRTRRDDA